MLSGDEEDDSPQKCREKRRRTIGRRRLEEAAAASSGGGGSTSFSSSGGLNVMPESSQQGDSAGDNINNSGVEIVVPMVGSLAVAGRQRDMEDAITVRTNLCSPEITRRRPVHFFGVYDGHGGSHVKLHR